MIENNKVESIGAHAIKGDAISITNGDLSIDNTRFTNNGIQSHITETPSSIETSLEGAIYIRSDGSPATLDLSYITVENSWISQTNETSKITNNLGAAIYAK